MDDPLQNSYRHFYFRIYRMRKSSPLKKTKRTDKNIGNSQQSKNCTCSWKSIGKNKTASTLRCYIAQFSLIDD